MGGARRRRVGLGGQLHHQGDTIFATWFTYDLDGSPLWLVGDCRRRRRTRRSSPERSTAPSGPRFDAFDPARSRRTTPVGSADAHVRRRQQRDVRLHGPGRRAWPRPLSQTKTITREIFAAPGTACQLAMRMAADARVTTCRHPAADARRCSRSRPCGRQCGRVSRARASGAAAARRSPRRIRRPAAPLARVRLADAADVDAVIARRRRRRASHGATCLRRSAARPCARFGALLREHKDALGTLVALENGKIKAEGDGEVQEMIDIADFAVGQSRMLYGRTIASERPQHRMMEQWHPLGVVGGDLGVQFPGRRMGVERDARRGLRQRDGLEAIAEDAADRARGAASREPRGDGRSTLPPIFLLAICGNAETHALVADPRVALVSFTGSSAVGREIATTVAARFGKCLLECAGNNAVVVARGRRSRSRRAVGAVRRRRHRRAALHVRRGGSSSTRRAWPKSRPARVRLRAGDDRRPARRRTR